MGHHIHVPLRNMVVCVNMNSLVEHTLYWSMPIAGQKAKKQKSEKLKLLM
jgi:hypothetical protein